jgi:hypothetical protein
MTVKRTRIASTDKRRRQDIRELLSLSALQWVVLLFPAWVFVLSLFIRNSEIRAARKEASATTGPVT